MNDNFKKEIVNAIQQNDECALEEVFEKIYYQYCDLIHYISLRIVKRVEVAEDITQEVFMRFFNNIKTTQFRNIKYWLVTAAKNSSLNYIKAKDYQVIYDDTDFLYLYSKENKIKPMIESLYQVLSEDEIDIIIMHLVFKCTFREIAADKEVSVNVIKGRYRRAIKKYKKFYN
ncbi:MAG: sigma-70 family RNA polymerase sigma factor [Bacilli bacterium]|nr:sigma-70 family RNA polymerase sigma factor [Bacilli bacterium]MDD4076622.1 sigma-70 family RNA polymerase sigma factor [Bacilli bacterium]MDD4388163.1 sigma-70 family RNA polymerase sigma factor [Bacilli bacterium]